MIFYCVDDVGTSEETVKGWTPYDIEFTFTDDVLREVTKSQKVKKPSWKENFFNLIRKQKPIEKPLESFVDIGIKILDVNSGVVQDMVSYYDINRFGYVSDFRRETLLTAVSDYLSINNRDKIRGLCSLISLDSVHHDLENYFKGREIFFPNNRKVHGMVC